MKRLLLITAGLVALSLGAGAQSSNNSFFNDMGEIASFSSIDSKKDITPIEFVNPRFDDIFWHREVYRMIDLREKINYPLYFPEESVDGRQSLFTLIFRLLQEGKVKGYEYQESREIFTDSYLSDFDKMLQTFDIIHSVKQNPATGEKTYVIDESDIPNREVIKYFLKEVWYFDKNNSTYHVRPIAICPLLVRETDLGLQKYPICWIPFETLRPYLVQNETLVSDRNSAARLSFDDLFIKRRFGSYIYKSSNQQNRAILEYVKNLEETKEEQDRIKTEMLDFEQDLWEY